VVIGFFAAVAPTLQLLEFSNGSEGLNVATALEIRRTRRWMIPTLLDETRLAKPPLAAWITAALIRDSTLADIGSADSVVRDRGFRALAWEARLPALLATCMALLATFVMARAVLAADANRRFAWTAVAIAASMLLTLRFCRYATTDVYMLMWVAVANAFLATAVFQGRWWIGCLGAGAVLGFSVLTKGPVGLIQTMLPAVLFAAIGPAVATTGKRSIRWSAVFAGLVVTVLLGLPWFAIVALREPDAWRVWLSEVSRIGATEAEPDAWYSYAQIVPLTAPWIGYFIVGLVGAAAATLKRTRPSLVFAATMLVVPILVMSLFQDRVLRYALPLVPAASLVSAISLCEHALARGKAGRTTFASALATAQWIILGSMAIGLPVAGAGLLRSMTRYETGTAWYSWPTALMAAAAASAVLLAGIVAQLRGARGAIVVTTFLIMMGLQALWMIGYATGREGRAETRPIADAVNSELPDAEVFCAHPDGKRPPTDLLVYLGRTVRRTRHPQDLVRGERPKVLLLLQREGKPIPVPPDGWIHQSVAPHGNGYWHAFKLAARPPTPSR